MNKLFITLLCLQLCTLSATAQSGPGVITIDYVAIVDGHIGEAMFYYEHNWKAFRDKALGKGLIDGYRLLRTDDRTADYQFLLVTEYRDQEQYKAIEGHYERLMKEINPDGVKLVNNLQPDAFRKVVRSGVLSTIFKGSYLVIPPDAFPDEEPVKTPDGKN